MRFFAYFSLLTCLIGCIPPVPDKTTPNPTPEPAELTECEAMCDHIGPTEEGGLGCPEGEPVYDSDLPGPVGEPNQSCEDFCVQQEANGVSLNPECVAKVESCGQIEAAISGCQ